MTVPLEIANMLYCFCDVLDREGEKKVVPQTKGGIEPEDIPQTVSVGHLLTKTLFSTQFSKTVCGTSVD